jgi:ArsR family transcriptional regulator
MAKELVPPVLLEQAARRFKLLSEPAQLQVRGEMNVQELVDATGLQQANVSKHLLLLAREGILRRRKEGLNVYYTIEDPTISGLCMLVCGRLQQETD